MLKRPWVPTGVKLPKAGLHDDDVLASIIRITGGNFRLLHRLLTQVARLVEINALAQVTREQGRGGSGAGKPRHWCCLTAWKRRDK